MHEVGGPIQWVDKPAHAGVTGSATGLLAKDCVVRALRAQHLRDGVFGGPVSSGNQVMCSRFGRHLQPTLAADGADGIGAGEGGVERGVDVLPGSEGFTMTIAVPAWMLRQPR